MKYLNATDILPKELLEQLQQLAGGSLVYVPTPQMPKVWGNKSGARAYYDARNAQIRQSHRRGETIAALASQHNLSRETIKKILYSQ